MALRMARAARKHQGNVTPELQLLNGFPMLYGELIQRRPSVGRFHEQQVEPVVTDQPPTVPPLAI